MAAMTIFAAVAAYVVLAVLLLSLNLTSTWRWWIKAGSIVVTTGFFVWTYAALVGLMGWPSTGQIPSRFKLVWTSIVEPDRITGASGAIYMWVETLDANNVASGVPRAYQIAYTDQLAEDVRAAQERREAGEEVMGTISENEEAEAQSQPEQMQNQAVDPRQDSRTDSVPYFTDSMVMTFEDLPPIVTPDKGPG
jgi:hypothetical protein